MDKIRDFILKFLAKEAECWSKSHLTNLDSFNQSIRELYAMAIDDLDEGLGIFEENELRENENPITYIPRHLFKLGNYQNEIYGDIWVAYVSTKNPNIDPKEEIFFQGFIIAYIENEYKVIGAMIINKNRSTMKIEGWKASVYNPSNLDIKKFGTFVSAERYSAPGDYDNFSFNEYLKDN